MLSFICSVWCVLDRGPRTGQLHLRDELGPVATIVRYVWSRLVWLWRRTVAMSTVVIVYWRCGVRVTPCKPPAVRTAGRESRLSCHISHRKKEIQLIWVKQRLGPASCLRCTHITGDTRGNLAQLWR